MQTACTALGAAANHLGKGGAGQARRVFRSRPQPPAAAKGFCMEQVHLVGNKKEQHKAAAVAGRWWISRWWGWWGLLEEWKLLRLCAI